VTTSAAASERAYVAENNGVVWTIDGTSLTNPIAGPGVAAGMALDASEERILMAVRGTPLLVALDLNSGQPVGSVALPADPAGVWIDPGLGRAYVIVPSLDALVTLDVSSLQALRVATGFELVTGVAIDTEAHAVYVSHLSGELSVVDGSSGAQVDRVRLSDVGLSGVAAGQGQVFAINTPGREFITFEPATRTVSRVRLADEPSTIAMPPQSTKLMLLLAPAEAIVALDGPSLAASGRVPLASGTIGSGSLAAEELWQRPALAVTADAAYVIDPRSGVLAIAEF